MNIAFDEKSVGSTNRAITLAKAGHITARVVMVLDEFYENYDHVKPSAEIDLRSQIEAEIAIALEGLK